jgi:pimeloyl-ACP methyl ester carboxylesterase
MSANKSLLLVFVIYLSLIFVACGNDNNAANVPTDYSDPAHWLSLPATTFPVDVFYLYPTAWTSTDPNNPQICDIDNASMLEQAPQAFARQATAFETVGNIYAPYYRQDNSSPIDRLNTIAGIPTMDATAAFDYYIKHYNNGRPFILAGHSQGATVLSNLLAGYMKINPTVYKRMIAAYVIGNPVTTAYLADNPHLKFAEGPDDTGVIISYNTEAPDVLPGTNPVLYGMVGLVINPITWTRDETLATKAEGLGSFMPDPKTLVFSPAPQYADAKIDTTNGVLICSTAACDEDALAIVDAAAGFPRGVYHTFDIPFYYFNIRANAANRTNNFLNSWVRLP